MALQAIAVGLKIERESPARLDGLARRNRAARRCQDPCNSCKPGDRLRSAPTRASAAPTSSSASRSKCRRRRFPRLAATEDAIRAQPFKAFKLPAGIRLSAPPGLEGGRLKLSLTPGAQTELRELSERLSAATATDEMAEIFALLAGRRGESGRKEAEIRVENDLQPVAQSVLKNAE